jgi:hypothetical protein
MGSRIGTPNRSFSEIDRRKIFSKTPKKEDLEISVIGVEEIDRNNPRGPTKCEETIFRAIGLGKKQITFWETDSSSIVDHQIRQ